MLLFDVRTPDEYRFLHAQGSISLPLENLSVAGLKRYLPNEIRNGTGSQIYLICYSGARAYRAYEMIARAYPNASVVWDGTLGWAQCRLPVVSGPE